jgi:hypothetical protein
MITELLNLPDTQSDLAFGPFEIPTNPFHKDILEAIASRRVLAIRYGNERLPRHFAPYLYRLAKNGNLIVIGVQIENQNSLDGNDERRSFNVLKITSLELTTETFVPVDTFKADDPSHASGIIACVLPSN